MNVAKKIEDRQLSWFGHITRMGAESKLRQLMEAEPSYQLEDQGLQQLQRTEERQSANLADQQ